MTTHIRKLRLAVFASSMSVIVIVCCGLYVRRNVHVSPPASYRQIGWHDLVPKDWDQFKRLREFNGGGLRDGDPRAQRLLADMRAAWDSAPTIESLDGTAVQVVGYVVPLEGDVRGLTELLLVPYEGACIHTPPPPANQIIHVLLAQPVKGLRMMDNVRVRGIINAHREATFRAVSGYDVSNAAAEEYRPAAGSR